MTRHPQRRRPALNVPRPILPDPAGAEAPAPSGGARTVLVVDDSRLQRRLLARQIEGFGYRVITASSAAEAAECLTPEVRIVVSDLVMPGGSGLDLCRAIRARGDAHGYVWFVLVTSSFDPEERAAGLHDGADDFLAKPVSPEELAARIAAGERILDMEARMAAANDRLAEALAEKDRLAAMVERDLRESSALQRSLLPPPEVRRGPATLSVILRSFDQVGGDLVGHFVTQPGRVGFYGIDVSGHGIASALMTARLKGYLSDRGGDNVATLRLDDDVQFGRPPSQVAARLNDLTLREMRTHHYFTMFYGELDLTSGHLRYVQAGHPAPLLLRADGTVEPVGEGGLPVGLIEDAEYDEGEITLAPGDRFLVHSDGFSECEGPGGMLGEARLARLVSDRRVLEGPALLDALVDETMRWSGGDACGDDISAILLDYCLPA